MWRGKQTQVGWLHWGRFNDAGTRFLITYEAQQKGESIDYTVIKHDPPVEARGAFYGEFKPTRPYNISVLPAANEQWYVYAIPGQTDAAVLPYGGDVRYTISADGTNILEKRQMHKIVLEEPLEKIPQFSFHTHFLSDVPEDSDVFYALTRKATDGEWIATTK